jgi:ATP-binding cassette subfamily F protein uup
LKKAASVSTAKPRAEATKKLSWNEQRELEGIEAAILAAESMVETLHAQAIDPTVVENHVKLHETYEQLARAQDEVERLYARWSELDARK